MLKILKDFIKEKNKEIKHYEVGMNLESEGGFVQVLVKFSLN